MKPARNKFYLLCFGGAQIFTLQRRAQVITISKKKNVKSQLEEIIKCSHLSLYTMDPSFCFPVFILYQTPVPELFQLFVILADAS